MQTRVWIVPLLAASGWTPSVVGQAVPLNVQPAALALGRDPEPVPADAAAAPADPDSFWRGWSGSIEFGLNGSEGNSESLNFRGGLTAKRATASMETAARLEYAYGRSGGTENKNRGLGEIRNDWLFGGDSRWSLFGLGRAEYDNFQDWDWRLSVFAGPGYTFIKRENYTLRGRVGAGLTREIGGRRNELIPEGLAGVDVNWTINPNTSFFFTGEYYPSFDDFSQFRLLGRAGIEVLLSEAHKVTLKLGVENRYQSDPGPGRKRNDVDFFALLAWNW